MAPGLKQSVTAFAHRLEGAEKRIWYKALAGNGWLAADWPQEHGGPGWNRTEQLVFIESLVCHRSPLPPDSISILAPLLLASGSPAQKQYFLPRILENPTGYNLQVAECPEPGCLLDLSTDSLFLVDDERIVTAFGAEGSATMLLAVSHSPLWLLYEHLLGLWHLQEMNRHWSETAATDTAQVAIDIEALKGLFYQASDETDQQIAFLINRDRMDCYSRLFQSLGYYALISPDSTLNANEPLPFTEQREFLAALRQQITRDEMIQQDRLYSEQINNETT